MPDIHLKPVAQADLIYLSHFVSIWAYPTRKCDSKFCMNAAAKTRILKKMFIVNFLHIDPVVFLKTYTNPLPHLTNVEGLIIIILV